MNESGMERKRLDELARRAAHSGRLAFTKFLEPSLERECAFAASEAGAKVAFFGGFDEAERRVAAFYAEDAPEEWEYPVVCLRLSWNAKYAAPGHRDMLGALMGLGINREETGDIVVGEGEAFLFALEEIADYIAANFESAGHAKLKIERAEGEIALPEPEGVQIRETVASERLDGVLAAGYNLSRAEAQRLIRSGLVKLNHVVETRTDARLNEGDLISARGHGRLKVLEFPGLTRRGRCAVILFRYGK